VALNVNVVFNVKVFMKKFSLLIPIIILLSGCSSLSPIEKESESESHFKDAFFAGSEFYISDDVISGERYRVFNEGMAVTDELKKTAIKKANEFCREKDSNQKMVTISEFGATPPYLWGNIPRIEIIFACKDRVNANSSSKTADNSKSKTELIIVDKYDRLSKIKNLLDNGVLTQDEFEAEKKKILAEK
jgi:hypothetical protein